MEIELRKDLEYDDEMLAAIALIAIGTLAVWLFSSWHPNLRTMLLNSRYFHWAYLCSFFVLFSLAQNNDYFMLDEYGRVIFYLIVGAFVLGELSIMRTRGRFWPRK